MKNVEIPAKCRSSQSKEQKEKKNEAKKRVSPANQKGKRRMGKIVEIPFDSNSDFVIEIKKKKKKTKKTTNVEVAQSSKPSARRTTKKNDCGLYICLFVEYISNGVFDMRSVDIDAKYHRQSESKVTGTVASKFDGPRITKEHAPDTSNYPTPRPRRSNLR
ncbi:hypothetical protein H5410_012446 [Solanum commersonii]|uniref:Uncharacterized protein n=1 Tax=Solanum commersonii TaxID=4109 RepID=A0A9J6AS72_SOLCO|nr:hypothetical protein H5410_012446 [Solanum commersonii]